jgi:hypothetical protein
MTEAAAKAKDTGVLYSCLWLIPNINVGQLISIDIMHQLFLGITQAFIKRILTSTDNEHCMCFGSTFVLKKDWRESIGSWAADGRGRGSERGRYKGRGRGKGRGVANAGRGHIDERATKPEITITRADLTKSSENNLKQLDQRIRYVTTILPPPLCLPDKKWTDVTSWRNLRAEDYKVFLFCYSATVFDGLLDNEVTECWLIMLAAFSLFCSRSLTDAMISEAHGLYMVFLDRYARLWGPWSVTINFHVVSHLGDSLRDFGPATLSNCFIYERLN